MKTIRSESSPLWVIAILLLLSLFSAFILFYFFESFAEIENKGIKVGGAAACFVIIFVLARNTYFKLAQSQDRKENVELLKQLELMKEQYDKTIKASLGDFTIPDNYSAEISQDFGFAFCFPKTWVFARFPQNTQYGVVIDPDSKKEINFARNINLIVKKVDTNGFVLKEAVQRENPALLSLFPSAEITLEEPFLLNGRSAFKQILQYQPENNQSMTGYQINVLNGVKDKLLQITYTTSRNDFESSKGLFENILSTFRL